MPTALVTGISGQDGSYLAELLVERGYKVVGLVRSTDAARLARLAAVRDRLELVPGDLLDESLLRHVLETHRPAEVYNLAARASSSQLFDDPVATAEYNGLAVARLLEIIRRVDPQIRFCQASSSEMFGNARDSPQDESTPFRPRNAYGIAKLCGHWFTVNYRETHGIFACSCILYNHESPRRGTEFVTRKISMAVARIQRGLQDRLLLGDLEARRDWGYAADYVYGMWQMLQAPCPDDYIIATGETHTVREFCSIAFRHVGLDYRQYVHIDPFSVRPSESVSLVGNAARARRVLGWAPTVAIDELARLMVQADLQALESAEADC